MSDEATNSSCLFCRIVAGEVPAEIVHSSDTVIAFRDINPGAPSHLLLIPKEHVTDVRDLEDRHGGMLTDLFQAASHLAKAEGLDESGWRLVTNVGSDAGQSVLHLHVHLLGGRPLSWPPG
ncbi:MAG TPA: histidine triad nucleotide-binding protein [Actinomycetota bacterium]|nr:histidine triad nucleotide-binding protein [Actinomycetota bacterium]